MQHYWLFKSEPGTFSIQDLKRCHDQTSAWEGVRNYQVRNMLRDKIKLGDQAFFYHSSCEPPGIVGVVEIVKEGYPDFCSWDKQSQYFDPKSTKDHPKWFMVDVKLVEIFPKMIALQSLKAHPELKSMQVAQRGNRLSITPVKKEEWDVILRLAWA